MGPGTKNLQGLHPPQIGDRAAIFELHHLSRKFDIRHSSRAELDIKEGAGTNPAARLHFPPHPDDIFGPPARQRGFIHVTGNETGYSAADHGISRNKAEPGERLPLPERSTPRQVPGIRSSIDDKWRALPFRAQADVRLIEAAAGSHGCQPAEEPRPLLIQRFMIMTPTFPSYEQKIEIGVQPQLTSPEFPEPEHRQRGGVRRPAF